MQCPFCDKEMKQSGIFLHCKGNFFKRHPLIQYLFADRSFQTRSEKVAKRLAEQGWRVYSHPGSDMFDIHHG